MNKHLPKSWFVISGLVLVASLGMLFANPMFVGATATNPAALTRLVGLLALVLALSWGVERFVPNRAAQALLIAVPVAALGWWMVSPAFINVRVDQALPSSAADLLAEPVSAPVAATSSVPRASSPAPSRTPTPTPAPTSVTSTEAAPESPPVPAASPAPTPSAAPTRSPSPSATASSGPAVEPAATPPTELRRGSFRGLDGHDAEGEAVLYRLADGTRFIRLEEIDVDNGPGLELYLVPGGDRQAPSSDSVFLGDLQGNQGSHNYTIPADVSDALLSGDLTVLIWCEPFQVAVGGATLG